MTTPHPWRYSLRVYAFADTPQSHLAAVKTALFAGERVTLCMSSGAITEYMRAVDPDEEADLNDDAIFSSTVGWLELRDIRRNLPRRVSLETWTASREALSALDYEEADRLRATALLPYLEMEDFADEAFAGSALPNCALDEDAESLIGAWTEDILRLVVDDETEYESDADDDHDDVIWEVEGVQAALAAGHQYVVRVLPYLAQYPLDLLLQWQAELESSLARYREVLDSFAGDSPNVSSTEQSRMFVEDMGHRLDGMYDDLKRQVRGARLWQSTRERLPEMAGAGVAISPSLVLNASRPLVACSILGAATASQLVTTTWRSLRRKRSLRTNPLYWRYVLERRGPWTE